MIVDLTTEGRDPYTLYHPIIILSYKAGIKVGEVGMGEGIV